MAWNFILYLLYGLAFFTLGVAILSRDIRFSENFRGSNYTLPGDDESRLPVLFSA